MLTMILSLIAPLFSLVLIIMASGLFSTFVSVRLEIEGYDPPIIGFVTSSLYGGILIGSLRIGRWIAKVGYVRSFIVFAIVSAALVLAQSIWINPWYWSFLRLIGGICMAGIFILIESWMLMQSSPKTRGTTLSLYLCVFYIALTLGQFLFNIVGMHEFLPFLITGILCMLSIIPLTIKKIQEPKIEQITQLSLGQLFRLSPLGFVGGIVSGMILAGIYGLVPVYAKEIGLSISQIGNLMAIIIFGGLSFQWPLGRWADSGKRRNILCLVSFLSAFFGLSIAIINQASLSFLLLLSWFFGGFSFSLYPLSMGYTCEKIQENQIIAATGSFVLAYGIGAIAGPIFAPLVMDLLGTPGLFYFLSGISFLLGLFSLLQRKENPIATEECTPSPTAPKKTDLKPQD